MIMVQPGTLDGKPVFIVFLRDITRRKPIAIARTLLQRFVFEVSQWIHENLIDLSSIYVALPIALVCHGAQVPAVYGLLKGRKTACFPPITGDMENAGATVVDVGINRVTDAADVDRLFPPDSPRRVVFGQPQDRGGQAGTV